MGKQLSKEMYQSFLLKILHDSFPEIYPRILLAKENTPLTGRSVSMRENDLFALYSLLCDLFRKNIVINDIYAFWDFNSIVSMLEELAESDADILQSIRKEIGI